MVGKKVIDLFSGMGGFSYGFPNAGFSVTGVDIADDVKGIYKKIPSSKFITADLSEELIDGDYDYVIGGPPCKPWSSINVTRRGDRHRDYNLVQRFTDNVLNINPRGFIMENVPLLRNDTLFQKQIERFKSAGYSVGIGVFRYSDFGAATSRRRLFTFGFKEISISDFLRNLETFKEPARTVYDAIGEFRYYQRGEYPDHVWPDLKTISRYTDYYKSGKFGWTRLEWDKPAQSFGNVMKTYTLHPDSCPTQPHPRVVSPLEVSRIMGFDRGFRFPEEVSLGRKYQMLADSVSPIFSEKIAKAIALTLRESR